MNFDHTVPADCFVWLLPAVLISDLEEQIVPLTSLRPASALIFRQTRRQGEAVQKYCEPPPTKYGGKLEGSLSYSGDLALISQFAEADTADAVVAQVGVRTTADLAAVVLTGGELRVTLLLEDHRFLSHSSSPP